MSPALVAKTYDVVLSPSGGFFRGAKPDLRGIDRALALRSRYGKPYRTLTDPMKPLVSRASRIGSKIASEANAVIGKEGALEESRSTTRAA